MIFASRFRPLSRAALAGMLVGALAAVAACNSAPARIGTTSSTAQQGVVQLLGIQPSAESRDYVANKGQFQLHTLLTEQRHKATWDLSTRISQDTAAGLQMLLAVDDDVSARLRTLPQEPALQRMQDALQRAITNQRKIFIYGTGATGRLAKEMESTFWRPFWAAVQAQPDIAAALRGKLSPTIQGDLIGEMTGADRALISSLEGFEDLQLIGRLQLADHGISQGDVVIEVTEGGETSAGIGVVLGALEQWTAAGEHPKQRVPSSRDDVLERAAEHLFFVYNNPDDVLRPFERSRSVIDQPGISKLNLTTGPQAITGSTRMQATTIETFVIAHALQQAVQQILARHLSPQQMQRLGFVAGTTLQQRLGGFPALLGAVKASVPQLARFTDLETATYRANRFSTYFAQRGLITVFIDSTERSPTFRLFPLDRVDTAPRQSWIQVWTDAKDGSAAWQAMLGRPFRGLDAALYRGPFEQQIDDGYLRKAALDSLTRAGDGQQQLYDLSFSADNIARRGPGPDDLGVLVTVGHEAAALRKPASAFARFGRLFDTHDAALALVHVGSQHAPQWPGAKADVQVSVGDRGDPFAVDQQIALKILLNAHSTAVMARLGKVVGNTMTNVSPSNLKLIGRATYLIQLHVNDMLARKAFIDSYGTHPPLSYADANAVLFDSIDYVRERKAAGDQAAAEVAVSIVRVLEALRRGQPVSNAQALEILRSQDLNAYLASLSRSGD